MSKQKKIVKIGASELTMSFFLQPYIKKFRALYQDIVVRMACTDPKSLLDEILSGVYDIGVLGTPIVYDERFAYRNLCELEYILAAGSSFHEIGKEAQSLSALPKYPLITMIENFSVRKYAEKLFSDNGIDVEWSIVVGSLPLLISMIKNNFGIGFLPKVYIQNALDDGSAFEIRLREALPKEHICFIRQRNSPEHGPGKQFIELLVQGTE
jgi:DNA-binding transcriptional LysR family regulator